MSYLSSVAAYIREHLLALSVWTAVALAPVRSALLTSLALVFLDLIFGVWAAKKKGESVAFSSAVRRTLGKAAAYSFILVLGFAVEQNLLGDAIPLVRIAGGWVGMTELRSIMKNLQGATGQDIWTALLARLTGLPQDQSPISLPPPPVPPVNFYQE